MIKLKTILAWGAFAVILLGAVAGLLLCRFHPNPKMVTSNGPMASFPAADAVNKAVTHSTSSIKPTREVSVEPSQPKREIRQPSAGLTSVNLESPDNSQDLDQNREWARNFPDEALAWLRNARDGKQRLTIAEIVCPELAQTNPAAAAVLAENCLGGGTNSVAQYLLDNMAQQWAAQDMQAASAWALAKPAGEQRDRLVQRIAFAESKTIHTRRRNWLRTRFHRDKPRTRRP